MKLNKDGTVWSQEPFLTGFLQTTSTSGGPSTCYDASMADVLYLINDSQILDQAYFLARVQ
jgi:hypothetical protein